MPRRARQRATTATDEDPCLFRIMPFATALLTLTLAHLPAANAGYFNCSVVYDEFDSLMHKQFLVEPDRYVGTLNGAISRSQFQSLQSGQFLLHADRAGLGIAVFHTNENLHGKLLYHFSEPVAGQPPHLIIDQAILIARVADGYGPTQLGPLRLKPGTELDLDRGEYVKTPPAGAFAEPGATGDPPRGDLRYQLDADSGEPGIAAVNGAAIQFPIESLCSGPTGAGNR